MGMAMFRGREGENDERPTSCLILLYSAHKSILGQIPGLSSDSTTDLSRDQPPFAMMCLRHGNGY